MNRFIEKYLQSLRVKKYSKVYKQSKLCTLVFLALIFLFSSCVTQRDVEYLRDKSKRPGDVKSFDEAKVLDYRLKPKDELFINIKSLDNPSTNVFEQVGNQQGQLNLTPYSASLMSYTIDKSGFIQLPFIGNILVQDRTVSEVIYILQDSISYILSNPTVTVKLVNRFVSVLGEVQRPGHFTYYQEKLTIFDALGLAGDITEYGDRNNVILVRNENGKNLRINIDLTSSNIMASEYYYIRPNDKIYVKPMRKKFWALRQFPYNIILATATTVLLFYTVLGG